MSQRQNPFHSCHQLSSFKSSTDELRIKIRKDKCRSLICVSYHVSCQTGLLPFVLCKYPCPIELEYFRWYKKLQILLLSDFLGAVLCSWRRYTENGQNRIENRKWSWKVIWNKIKISKRRRGVINIIIVFGNQKL